MRIYIKALGYVFGTILILTFLVSTLHYFNVISVNIVNATKLMIPIVGLIIGGFKIGKIADKKGWLEGIKLAAITILILLLLTLIFRLGISVKIFIYYLIVIASAIIGGMLGISRKLKNKV